jgi:predicted ATP-grasp superfamily ATP-dependent carboligase
VLTLAPKRELMASASRYSRQTFPWPAGGDNEQLGYLLALAEEHRLDGWALFATDDESVALFARHHAVLANRFRLTVPPWDVLRWAYDKRLTYRLAAETGVGHPETFYPRTPDDLWNLDCSFPVILKPAFKAHLNRFTRDRAWRADDRGALAAGYAEACELVGPDVVMVQELIPGGGETQFSYTALCVDGRCLASLTARRTRQYPVDFARSSTFVETLDQPAIEESAGRLLHAMGYTGLAELEFKFDHRDGRYKLLDVNPRVWTWIGLCGRADVDFPYLLWCSVHGQSLPQLRGRPGVRWVRMSTDLAAASVEILRGRLSLRAYLRSLNGPMEFATFAADDPFPALLCLPARGYALWSGYLLPGILRLRSSFASLGRRIPRAREENGETSFEACDVRDVGEPHTPFK